jgi:hypothetical protein
MFVPVRVVCQQHGSSVLAFGGVYFQGVKLITVVIIVKIGFGQEVNHGDQSWSGVG